MKPIRVQRKRVNGWKMPDNTVSVCRPGKYGNPFKLVGDMIYINSGYRRKLLDKWVYFCQGDERKVVLLFEGLVKGFGKDHENPDVRYWHNHFDNIDLMELKGFNLACFCGPDNHCHADILLQIANP